MYSTQHGGNNMKLQLLTAVALTALMSVPSLAQADDEGWYVRGNIGYGLMNDADFTGDLLGDVEGEGNAAISLGAGYEFGNNWRLELDVAQIWNDLGAIGQIPSTSADLRTTSAMLNAIYDFPGFGNWEPYLGAGIGVVNGNLSASAHDFANGIIPVNTPACSQPTCEFDDADGGIGWQVLAGLGYKITDNLTWDTQYRYQSFGDFGFDGVTIPTSGTAIALGSQLEGVDTHSLMTGLRYRFGASTPAPTYTCWNGNTVEDLATCPIEPKTVYVSCWDGSQVEEGNSCPARIECWDGSAVTDAASCPARPSVTCWDGSTAYDQASCPVKTYEYSLCENEYRQEIVYYEFDKPQSAETEAKIQRILDTGKFCSVGNIHVVGHTDSSGSAAYNLRLSKKRAADVRSTLVDQGVAQNLITSEGKGETELFIDTGDGVKEQLNRRTEILIRLNQVGVVN
jgi:opacity protein-like surface antigen/outer membrane protein OmpA-like peptidoglycan-associated protein